MSLPVSASGTDTPTSQPQRVRPSFVVIYVLALFGIWMSINLPASVTLALRIGELDPEGKATSYSMAAGIGTLTALLANPLFGRLSDRTRSRFGRRRPWIVVGISGTIAGAVVIGVSDSMPLLLIGWIIMQAFVNAAIASSLAIVADRIPEKQQGLIGALSGMASSAAMLVGVFFVQWFPSNTLAQFGLPVAVAVVFCSILLAMMRDDTPAVGDIAPFSLKEFLGSFYVSPHKSPDFSRFLVAMFLTTCSWGVVSTYTVYLLQDRIAVPAEALPGVITLAYVIPGILAVIFAPVAGWLNDRTGRRKVVLGSTALIMATGTLVIIFADGLVPFLIGISIVSGVAGGMLYGGYIGFAVATMNDPNTAARDLGVTNIAFTLPFSVMPFIAPMLLGVGGGDANYAALLTAGAALTLLGIIPLFFIRSTR